ncbi:hypothetical protein ZIOFF_019843 [Zingiber officinale]|uniref:THH1/TOM1/TOM3 domain-containing protein n=1 Tax=Zingiber officinale TaxID=94328 RepID=A0A8J5HSH3_ZINOF|nr:hypothetical protein ZIOFF_019843 [Zingiber officinale]
MDISEMSWLPATARSWWANAGHSSQWQDAAFYSLCAAYSCVSAFALIQVVRNQLRSPEYGWTTQKVFHFMNFMVNGVRALVFGFHKHVFLLRPRVFALVLLDLPGLLFFSTYTLLVLYWAEIYHQVSIPSVFNWQTGVCIWIYLWINGGRIVESVGNIFLAAALGFLVYGGRHFPIESRGRQKKLYEVGSVAAVCFTCFLIRCLVLGLSAMDSGASLDVLDHPILDFSFYMMTEILPSALVLYILRKLPPKSVSGQYHPIR